MGSVVVEAGKKVVTEVGSVLSENKGTITAVGGAGKTGVRGAEAVKVSEEAAGVYGTVKAGLATARTLAALASTVPVIGEAIGTLPQIAITGVELVADVAAGQRSEVVMKNLASNGLQIAADAVPGGGIASLVVKGGMSMASGAMQGGAEDVKTAGGMPPEVVGKTPSKLASADIKNHRG